MQIGAYVAMVACLVVYLRQVHFDLLGGLAIGYLAAMLLSCLINEGNSGYILYTLQVYGPCSASLLLAVALVPNHRAKLLWGIVAVTGTYTLLNFLVLCLVPIGDTLLRPNVDYTFLAYRNSFCRFYLPAIGASLLLDQDRGRLCSIRSATLFCLALAQSLIAYSATSVFALLVFVAGICLVSTKRPRKYLNALTFGGIYMATFIGFVLLRLQDAFANLIASFGRDSTFTGRTDIWDLILSLIDRQHFLLGYNGVEELVFPAGWRIGVAHNAILDILLWGGAVALCLVVAIYIATSMNLYRQRTNRSAAILSVYLGTFLLMGVVEFIACPAFFMFLGIAWSWKASPQLSSNSDKVSTDGERLMG